MSYSQESYFVEGKGYYGYVFSKEHSIWGFPPEIIIGSVPIGSYRCNLTEENIVQSEKILKKNINSKYVKSCQIWGDKPYINKNTLANYNRQYVGYLTPDNEVIVCVYLIIKTNSIGDDKLSEDIIVIYDGGYSYWTIAINLKTRKVFDMMVNGES